MYVIIFRGSWLLLHSSLAFLRLHVPLMTTQMIILRLQITNSCEGLRRLVAEFVDGTPEVHAKVEERHAEGREADEELAGQACCATSAVAGRFLL